MACLYALVTVAFLLTPTLETVANDGGCDDNIAGGVKDDGCEDDGCEDDGGEDDGCEDDGGEDDGCEDDGG
eukprot:CAMPEP_0175162634 /NCGR_PEP_ID=MMETSP0087-20121206/25262_1 /TAXON_ID=136419 /ORGANISM="Unknown Unknown, Strain D1" /LENGTH=70 /DNA_ID=CAMNT_0016451167 /DNA_START=272 /DNA_END=482 /DNA_ORIENTATION=+